MEAVYVVKTAIYKKIAREKGEIYLFFMDMIVAFDNIRRRGRGRDRGTVKNKNKRYI